jgi:hypothetical protein
LASKKAAINDSYHVLAEPYANEGIARQMRDVNLKQSSFP